MIATRYSISRMIKGISSVALCILMVCVCTIAQENHLLHSESITLAVSTRPNTWNLSVNSAGEGELVIDSATPFRKTFDLSAEDMRAFAKVVRQFKFFDLKPNYGQIVPDGGELKITIVDGSLANTVQLNYIMNYVVHREREELLDIQPIVEILRNLFGLLDDVTAIPGNPGQYYAGICSRIDDVIGRK